MLDSEILDAFLKRLLDHYTATELVDRLDLTTEDIVDAFYELIMENSRDLTEDMDYGA